MDEKKQVEKGTEDVHAHERRGLVVNDERNDQVDLNADGTIQEQDRQSVWS